MDQRSESLGRIVSSSPLLRLWWFGYPRIELSGSQIRLETRKTTALLAYLSLNEQPQSREKLAALFWPDFDQSRAPANLRRSLASLHASIPGDWLDAERDRISLRSDTNKWIDVLAARQLVADTKVHPHGSVKSCPECLDRTAKAILLFQGEFLEGFNLPDCPLFDEWQTAERENLQTELERLLERSARGLAAAERWEEALQAGKRWLAQDRMNEEAQATLMQILTLSGQRSAAIRQYEEYCEALQDEFGQEPDKATQELYNQILSRRIGAEEKSKDAQRSGTEGSGTPQPSALPRGAADVDRGAGNRGVEYSPGLLNTKLSVPPLREGTVRRHRLIRILEQGLVRGLIVVSAPAGFGKTTILSELASQAKMPIAWLSLDEGDNDSRRFLLHLFASISRSGAASGDEVSEMLRAMPPAPTEMVVTALINAVQERGKGLALILDDYQFIHSTEVHAALRFLIDHRPESLVIFIATREDPPIPLARLRSQDRVTEIRVEDLRFTAEEADSFFKQAMSLSLSPTQVEVLERGTEGWIAGLQMAALSLRGREDVEGFISSFGGTHRYIMEYLVEEVLSGLDDETTRFLLDTSILSKMSASLCDAVTGHSGCQETLRQLERMNLFLVPLDEHGCWFRYHHLFADLLRHRLEFEHCPERIQELRCRAGDWFAAQGELATAIQEYLAAKAYEKAADLIAANYYEIISNGALGGLQVWCAEIPPEIMERRPGYLLAGAWALAWAGQRHEAEALLDRVEQRDAVLIGVPEEENLSFDGTAATIRALIADMAGESEKAVVLAREADRILPEKDHMSKTLILYILAKSYIEQGELERAEEPCAAFLRACNASGSIWSISAAILEIVHLRGLQGRLRDAQVLIQDFDALAERRRARGSGPIAKVYALMADFKRERGELDEALKIAEGAVKAVDAWGLPSDVYMTHQYLARVLRSRGQAELALVELEKVRLLPRSALVWAGIQSSFDADRVKTFLALGDIGSAEAVIREREPGKASTLVSREVEIVSLTRVRLAAGASAESLAETSSLLDGLASSTRKAGRFGPLITILILQAKARASLLALDDALDALDEAVRLAQPEGYFRIFIEEGPKISELLLYGQRFGMWSTSPVKEYVNGLLSAFSIPA